MLRIDLLLALGLLLAVPASFPTDAHAQAKKGAPKVDLSKIGSELESGDEARILAALDRIAQAEEAGKTAAPQLEKLLEGGTSTKVAVRALDVAGGLKQQSSSSAIAPYVQHRVAEVRRAAVRALIKTRGPAAVTALRKALRSSDPQVRGFAATGLGSMGAKQALADLFAALDRKVVEAAAAIGQLCAGKDCEKLVARLGKLPLDVMTSGLDQILFRPPAEIDDDQKIAVVGRLRELGTKDAGSYLRDVAERWPENWSKKVKQALDSAVKASGVGSKEGS